MNAVLYARVSSKEQAREGFSIPAQQKFLREYALNKGFSIVKEFTDIETAKATGRTNFGEMIKFLKKTSSVKVVLVEKTDRLYRNIKDWVTLDDLMYELNLEIHYVKENFVLSHESRSMEKFMHGIKVLMAKNYIDNLSDEIKKGMKEKVLQGGFPHKPPAGYTNNPETRNIDIDPGTAPYVIKLFELYASGNYSLRALRKKCIEENFFVRDSEPRISVSSLERILKNEFYIGFFEWKGKRYRGNHEPIISSDLFEAVRNQFKSLNRPKEIKRNFIYSGLMTCARCGCAITSAMQKGRYVYYYCTNFHGNCEPVYVREEALDEQYEAIINSIKLDDDVLDWVRFILKSSLEDEKKFHKNAIDDLRKKMDKLQDRLEKLYLDKLDGTITDEFWQKKDFEWREEIRKVNVTMDAHGKADESYLLTGIRTFELLQKVALLYSGRSAEEKRKFLNILLLNSKLDGDRVIPQFREPFDLIGEIPNLKEGKLLELTSISPQSQEWWSSIYLRSQAYMNRGKFYARSE